MLPPPAAAQPLSAEGTRAAGGLPECLAGRRLRAAPYLTTSLHAKGLGRGDGGELGGPGWRLADEGQGSV